MNYNRITRLGYRKTSGVLDRVQPGHRTGMVQC